MTLHHYEEVAMPAVRRSLRALALCAATVVLSTALPATAVAEQGEGWARHSKVGWIEGWYQIKPKRDYRGVAYPYWTDTHKQCVVVERKLAGDDGYWTDSFVGVEGSSADSRAGCARFDWSITNDTAVANTVAIRLRVRSGPNAPGSLVNLCDTKTECLAMRE